MTDVNLSAIQSLAATVAAQHADLISALSEEAQAQVTMLDAVVAAARPALRACSSKIKTSRREWWIGSTHTDSETTYADVRGLVVSDDAGPDRHNPSRDQNRGRYTGADLVLTADGRWLEMTYDGRWSQWQGETSEWTATQDFVDTATVIRNKWSVDAIIKLITAALTAQAEGKSADRAKAARERAERMTALSRLL